MTERAGLSVNIELSEEVERMPQEFLDELVAYLRKSIKDRQDVSECFVIWNDAMGDDSDGVAECIRIR